MSFICLTGDSWTTFPLMMTEDQNIIGSPSRDPHNPLHPVARCIAKGLIHLVGGGETLIANCYGDTGTLMDTFRREFAICSATLSIITIRSIITGTRRRSCQAVMTSCGRGSSIIFYYNKQGMQIPIPPPNLHCSKLNHLLRLLLTQVTGQDGTGRSPAASDRVMNIQLPSFSSSSIFIIFYLGHLGERCAYHASYQERRRRRRRRWRLNSRLMMLLLSANDEPTLRRPLSPRNIYINKPIPLSVSVPPSLVLSPDWISR